MALLTREQILQADDIKCEDVPCPNWGGEVRIAIMSGEEREAFDSEMNALRKAAGLDEDGHFNARVLLVCHTARNADGTRLFSDPADVKLLGKKSGADLDACYGAALRMNYLGSGERKDLEKN